MASILLFGSTGQLGSDLVQQLADHDLHPYGHLDIDLNDFEQIDRAVDEHQPEWLINASAYNDVVLAESKPGPAFAINAEAVWAMARAARRCGASLVHFSTDYVFAGDRGRPCVESDPVEPLNVYATSKLAGEYLAMNSFRWYIFRVSALFGTAGCRTKGGTNFVDQVLNQASLGKPVRMVRDKVCSPTFSLDVARYLSANLFSLEPGLYHLSNQGSCTWVEFAGEILKQAGLEASVEPFEDTGTIRRPFNSALASEKIPPLRPWQEALGEYIELKRKGLESL